MCEYIIISFYIYIYTYIIHMLHIWWKSKTSQRLIWTCLMEGEWSWWCCAVFPLHASDDWVEGDRWLHSGWPRVPSSARGPARQMPRPLQGQAWGGECSDLAPPNDPGKELEGYQRGVPLYAFSPECITLGFGHFVLNLEIGVWGEPILCGVPKIYIYIYIIQNM